MRANIEPGTHVEGDVLIGADESCASVSFSVLVFERWRANQTEVRRDPSELGGRPRDPGQGLLR